MLLKLIMSYNDDLAWKVYAGSIVRWHKREGDKVNYGDDLFDLKVEETVLPSALVELSERVLAINERPSDVAKFAAEQLHQNYTGIQAIDLDGPQTRLKGTFFMRTTSSDSGFLRRIYKREGERSETGDLIALLTSSEDDSIPPHDNAVSHAVTFRAVGNIFHSQSPQNQEDNIPRPGEHMNRSHPRYVGQTHIIVGSDAGGQRHTGIYFTGRRYLNSIFGCASLIESIVDGTCCIFRDALPALRSDLLLQTRTFPSDEALEPVINTLRLSPAVFRPDFFKPTFEADRAGIPEEFPKTIICLSILPDILGTAYRHGELGFLVDPGVDWLNHQYARILAGFPSPKLDWFRETFECLGKLSVEDFIHYFARLIRLLRDETGAQVIVFNAASVSARGRVHNYASVRESQTLRRMEFNIALIEMSRTLNFATVDVDRIVKRSGLTEQVNWDQFAPELHGEIALEAFRVIKDRGLLGNANVTGI